MQIRKKWIIILSVSAFCMLCLNAYFLFFFDAPTKRPGASEPDLAGEHQNEYDITKLAEDNGDSTVGSEYDDVKGIEINIDRNDTQIVDEQGTLASSDKGVSIDSDIYVREIPIALPADMDSHLTEFRRKAKHLQQSYPKSFLIAMPATEKTVALTFDDGPDSSSTLKIIEILNSYQVPGTFFFVGQQVNRHAEAVKAALAGGHVVANHSWSHVRPTDANTDLLMEEVQRTQDDLSEFGAEAKLFRPPYGLVNEDQMPALIQAGFKTVAWSIDSMDWYFDKPEDIVTCVTKNIHPGAIVLMHSSGGPSNRQATIEALPIIIETLQEQGYRFVSLP
jgi:peptidoglycan/xylan/chitin deacetylase (PgdA/CDA1 family)